MNSYTLEAQIEELMYGSDEPWPQDDHDDADFTNYPRYADYVPPQFDQDQIEVF